jgi:hypothetical protein
VALTCKSYAERPLTQFLTQKQKWFEDRKVDIYVSDYSEDSVLSILNSSNATALISFINCPNNRYIDIHCAFLNACIKSKECKRFIPSEWVGNVEDYPLLPSFYGTSREPFRKILRESSGIEWTLFNGGWLMDYFLPKEKTYMPPIPDEFPVDPNNWRACIRGTGNETQAWTCAREIGKAVVELLAAPQWVRQNWFTCLVDKVFYIFRSGFLTVCRSR